MIINDILMCGTHLIKWCIFFKYLVYWLTREHSQLSDAVRLDILAMNRTQWDEENPRRVRAHGQLTRCNDRFTEFSTYS